MSPPTRAVEVQTLLGDRPQQRAPNVRHLLIAATAELAGLVVSHLDADLEFIAAITSRTLQRLTS